MRIGIDLGGTRIEGIVLGDHGRELWRARFRSPHDSYREAIATLCALVRRAERELGASGSVGVGAPGTVSRASGLMKNCTSIWLNGRSLHQDLETALEHSVRGVLRASDPRASLETANE